MSQLAGFVVEATQPEELAGFWAALLGWDVTGGDTVRAPASEGTDFALVFVPESGPKRTRNRIHPDLAAYSPEGHRAKVGQALALGARPCDIGQGEVPWVVLSDPEGNEFCVLEPRPGYTTTESLAAVVVNAVEPLALASFWAEATGWRIGAREPVIVGLRAPTGRGPWLEFLRTSERKERPNRVRFLVRHDSRLTTAPGRADPEGNEFLLLEWP
jgi:hypothetical protein